ncbi:hypothetical protein RHMOL_Rhmol08G0137400 [Rhododendron molle]|uniref:Uncharacterized protein n=1 Tax=Rhododendron molle TaxID=49168 RepID=A0ACC0MNG2_RHOML|nr:hypothetical protein RHMOL_Rhmol08G0137400 [Rhododendron molle]
MVLQLSQIFTILLFHYDGQTSEWDEFEWSKRAIHDCGNLRTIIFLLGMKTSGSSILIQRSGMPNVFCILGLLQSTNDYVFIRDEDLGVKHFDPEGLSSRESEERRCTDPHLPPCAAYICCNHDTCVFSRRMALCLAYDSSTEHYLHVLLLLPTLQVVKIFISTACGVCQMRYVPSTIEPTKSYTTNLVVKLKYLMAFTVGYDQKKNIDAVVNKTSEWDEFEWSKRAIHIIVRK